MFGNVNGGDNGGDRPPLIQYGQTGSSRSVTFEKEYKAAPVVLLSIDAGDPNYVKSAGVSKVTPTGFTCYAWYHVIGGTVGGAAGAENIYWIAIGEEK